MLKLVQHDNQRKMNNFVVVVNVTAKENQVNFTRKTLSSLLDYTRKERGCVVFDLHQDKNNPAHFFFYEVWENKAVWEAHMSTPFLTKYKEKTADAFANISFNLMTKIEN